MFSKHLKEKYPFLTNYFENGIKSKAHSLSHSILFFGQDTQVQYEFAIEIARFLNCKEFKNQACQCLDCNWIKEGKHPAVLTFSKIDNKPPDDDSKTVISVKQTQVIKNLLLNTSDYYRIFIFCDSDIEKVNGEEKKVIKGLNESNFQSETANSLLKIVEEPPENTMFFFLTRDKNDLLETIISRSQSFFIPSYEKEERDFSIIQDIFSTYPDIQRKDSFDLAQDLFSLSKEYGNFVILQQIQNYLLNLLKLNMDNIFIKNKIILDIKYVNKSKKMIESHLNPLTVFEDMCLNFTN